MRGPPRRFRLEDLGEWGLLARLPRLLPAEPAWVVIGRGADDAAAIRLGVGELALLTCDVQLERRHFRREWITPRQLGRRAASVNLSDIAAMGGKPRAAVASLLLPPDLGVAWFDALMLGLGERLAEHGAALVGGNLARSARDVAVDVTLLGSASARSCVGRGGARPGDRILVTGWLGESAAGRMALRRGLGSGTAGGRAPSARRRRAPGAAPDGGGPRVADWRRLVARHLDPTPRVVEGRRLAARGVTAMIDLSDGLASDLRHLCAASHVGAEIDLDALPVSPALARAAPALGRLAWHLALGGGEDYELLCTAPAARVPALRRALARATGVELTEIGTILPRASGIWTRRGARRSRLAVLGYEHFAPAPGSPRKRRP